MKGLTPRCLPVTLIAALAGMASLRTASSSETPSVSSFPMKPITTPIALAIFITAGVTALPAPIQDKTLVAWVCPSNLTQQGGSVLTLIDKAEHFDAIVLGELARGKWMAGSDFFRRTHQDQSTWPLETAGSNTLIQLAITYRGDRITLFRNGKECAAYTMGQAQTFADDAMVLLGLRYVGGMGEIGFLIGAIEDVRIYDIALNAGQIGALVPNEPSDPKPLAWWTFENGKADDVMKRFPASRLEGNARVAGGKLILDGSSYLWVARDAKLLTTEPVEDSFDASVQTLFYKARSKRTGNMWDTWMHFHEGKYYLYSLFSGTGFFTKEGTPAMIYHGWTSGRNQIAFALDDLLEKWSKPIALEPLTASGEKPDMAPLNPDDYWEPDCWLMDDTYYALSGGSHPKLIQVGFLCARIAVDERRSTGHVGLVYAIGK